MLNIFNKPFYHTDRNINCYGRVSMWPDSTRDALLVEILCNRFKGKYFELYKDSHLLIRSFQR